MNYFAYPGLTLDYRLVRMHNIFDAVLNCTGVSLKKMKAGSRNRNIIEAKHLSIYFLRGNLKMTLKEIGKIFGLHYSSVIHAINGISDLLITDEQVKGKFLLINSTIYRL